MTKITVFIIMVVISIDHVWNLQVIFERSNISCINEKYLTDCKTYVRRYARRGDYYLNLFGTTKHTWGNNVTLAQCISSQDQDVNMYAVAVRPKGRTATAMSIEFVFYEFLHNEYKRSFVEYASKLCDLVKTPYIGRGLIDAGLECPAPPRHWILANISIPMHKFPNMFPFEKCRLDTLILTFPEKELIAELQIHLIMKQVIGK